MSISARQQRGVAPADHNRDAGIAARGQAMPGTPVRVELTAPDVTAWTWGPADAEDRVSGTALDFCLLVTQRRHRDDLALAVDGPAAQQWMAIAQAFAGPPGPGRRPTAEQDNNR